MCNSSGVASLTVRAGLAVVKHSGWALSPSSRGLLRPSPQQVPTSQTQMFRDQQPQTGHVVADLIGQPLPDPALDAERIAGDVPNHSLSDPRLDLLVFQARAAPVEFFFAGRSRSARAGRCGC